MQLLDKVGGCYFLVSDFENALLFFRKSLQEKEAVFRAGAATVAETLNNVGECHRELSHYDDALVYFQRALKIVWPQRTQTTFAQFIALLYNNMGISCKQSGQKRKALNYYEESHKLKSKISGP